MTCHALPERPYQPKPRAAVGHMPFFDHRTVAEIWAEEASLRAEKEARSKILRSLGR